MPESPSIIERAFELARTGGCRSVDEINRQLKKEHFEGVEQHLSGGSIKRDLRKLLEAKKKDEANPVSA